jgi:hypothetical protein
MQYYVFNVSNTGKFTVYSKTSFSATLRFEGLTITTKLSVGIFPLSINHSKLTNFASIEYRYLHIKIIIPLQKIHKYAPISTDCLELSAKLVEKQTPKSGETVSLRLVSVRWGGAGIK